MALFIFNGMAAVYGCKLSLDTRRCMERLGIVERGRVQRVACEEILRLCDTYVPFSDGELKDAGHVEYNTEIVWNRPYAHYMYEGIVYEDTVLHCAGFKTENGWRSRKNVQKVPSAHVSRARLTQTGLPIMILARNCQSG